MKMVLYWGSNGMKNCFKGLVESHGSKGIGVSTLCVCVCLFKVIGSESLHHSEPFSVHL